MLAKTIKDYCKTIDVFAKDLPPSIWHSSIQAVTGEFKVMQVHEDFALLESPSMLPETELVLL